MTTSEMIGVLEITTRINFAHNHHWVNKVKSTFENIHFNYVTE